MFFSPSTLPHRQVVTVIVLQSCGVQFYVLLRMAITPDKKDKAYTKTKAYTRQKPTQDKSLHKTKAYTKQKPRQKQNHCGARRGGGGKYVGQNKAKTDNHSKGVVVFQTGFLYFP